MGDGTDQAAVELGLEAGGDPNDGHFFILSGKFILTNFAFLFALYIQGVSFTLTKVNWLY